MFKILFTVISLWFGVNAMAQNNGNSDFKIPELTTYYFCQINKGPNWTDADTPEHQRLQERHLQYILKLTQEGKIIIAGPFKDADDARGIAIYQTGSLEAAKALGAADPKVKAGHLQLKWYTWMAPKGVLPTVSFLGKTKTSR